MNCWVASPQDVARTSTSRFESYVRSVVRRFKHDTRVLWWETFNEPTIQHSDYSDFSFALRSEAYKWAKAEAPDAPVIACWDDGNYTDVVDHHTYSGDMADLKQKAIANPAKGGLVTESGCRWYRTYDRDAGSPLNVINLLTAMRAERAAGEPSVPFVPGAMLAWELMVGNVNTRFQVRATHRPSPLAARVLCLTPLVLVSPLQWKDRAGETPEPPVPWCAHLYPDGSPVSYTEAAATREYLTGVSDFLFVDTFLPLASNLTNDVWRSLPVGEAYAPTNAVVADGLVETLLWPDTNTSVLRLTLRAGAGEGVSDGAFEIVLTVAPCGANGQCDGLVEVRRGGKQIAAVTTKGRLFLGAWNLLRAVLTRDTVAIYLNPQYPDAYRPGGVLGSPLLNVSSPGAPSSGRVELCADAGGDDMRVSYVAVLPLSVL